MRSFYSLSLRFLIRRPGKTIGSIMGIALGVAVIVAAAGASEAARAQLDRSLTSMLGRADLVVSHARPFDTGPARKALKGLPVKAQAGQLFFPARLELGAGKKTGEFITASVFGLDPIETRRFWPIKMASGRFVVSKDNIVLSAPLARRLNRKPGDKIELLTGAGRVRKRVAGVLAEVGLGNQGAPAVYMGLESAQRDQQLKNRLSYIFLELKPGASVAAVSKSLSRSLGTDINIGRTPATSAYALKLVNTLRSALIAVGSLALVVGTLIIYQSTNVAAAQLIPTLALIKALGATKRQLVKVFLLESSIVGGLASIAGAIIGFLLAKVVTSGLVSMLGSSRPRLLPPAALLLTIVSIGVGVAVTATCLPVVKSLRLPVADALRLKASTGRRGPGRMLGKLIEAIGPLLERMGPNALLAQKNLTHNFRRLRLTAVCLIAGLAMIIGSQIGMGAGKQAMDKYFAFYVRGTYIVRAAEMPGGDVTARIPLATVRQLKRMADVKDVIPFFLGGVHYRGRETMMQSAAAGEPEKWIYTQGDPRTTAARLRSGNWVALTTSFAQKHKLDVGDKIDLEAGGYKHGFRVAAVTVSVREAVLVPWQDMRRYFNILEADDIFILPVKDAKPEVLSARLKRFAGQRGYFFLTGEQFMRQMDGYVGAFTAILLGITGSVLMLTALALANMMVVGALERRRLLGVLRGQGMTRSQLVGLLISENIAVGLLSLPVGLALGYTVGQIFIALMRASLGATVSEAGGLWIFPASALIMLAVLYITAIFPARRIASTPVAEALRYE